MRHAWLRAQHSAFLDGSLPPRRRARLERHLAGCEPCRRELRELQRTVRLLQQLPPLAIDAELTGPVSAEVAARTLGAARREGTLGRWLAPVAATCAVALVLVAVQAVEISLRWPAGGSGGAAPVPAEARVAREPVAPPRGAGARPLVAFQAEQEPELPPPARERSREWARALERPLPPLAACLTPSPGGRPECAGWHAWLVDLATRDLSVFIVEMEALPAGVREHWLGEVSHFAADAGAASWLAEELRASGDPRASSLARRFERTASLAARR